MAANKNIKLILNYVAGPLIMLLLFYSVVRQLRQQPHWKDSLDDLLTALRGRSQWKFYATFFFMGVNWSIESLKWQLALRPVQVVPFGRALKAILAGSCIASFTPNRVGEYLGRMLFVDEGKKLDSVTPSIICSLAQMLVTLVAGLAGIWFFYRMSPSGSWFTPVILKTAGIFTGVSAIILSLIYFRFEPVLTRVNRWLEKRRKSFRIPQDYPIVLLFRVLILSVFRYLVFLIQYFLLFSLFGIALGGVQLFAGVSLMFVLMAIVPTLTFLTDLGFRWLAGIEVFRIFTSNIAGILAVSLGIWLINLIIPALIGSLLILRTKPFRS